MVMFAIFAGVLVLLLLGVTTAVTMGFASIATFLMAGGDMARLFLVPQRMFSQVSGITLMSIPFFLLMGNLMSVGGISKSLFGFGRVCLGHRAGGLSNAAIVACIVMAAMSGSAAACAAGIGMIAIAEMTKSGYDRAFSCATIAAGDTWENSTIIENAGADAEGVVLSTFFDEAEPANDEAAAFIEGFKEYLKENDQEEIIPAVSALGYDAYLAAIAAIEAAGSTDTTAIRDALQNVQIDGVTGSITFDENVGNILAEKSCVSPVEPESRKEQD